MNVFFDNITINEYVQHLADLTSHFGPDYAGALYEKKSFVILVVVFHYSLVHPLLVSKMACDQLFVLMMFLSLTCVLILKLVVL